MQDKSTLELIGHIYDAAMHPQYWDDVLDQYTVASGAASATIQVIDPLYSAHHYTVLSSRFRDHPDSASLMREYFENVWRQEQVMYENGLADRKQGFRQDYEGLGFPDASCLASHAPTLWLREHFGIYNRMASRLNVKDIWLDLVSLQYDANRGEATPDEIAHAMVFVPHMAKAVELGREFTVLRSRFNAVLDALDYYQVGTILVSQEANILLENNEARRILEDRDGLERSLDGKLNITTAATSSLSGMIRNCAMTARGEGMDSEKLLTVMRKSGKDDYILTIAPMRDPENALDAHFRGAIVYVVDPARISVISTRGMAEIYGLTAAEDEVCRLLVEGLDTSEIVERRDVSTETVRSQIKRIMQKTRVQNRASLIRLALSINLPIDEAPSSD
jgi:DNA-binding CsgD family transcriptional regulator